MFLCEYSQAAVFSVYKFYYTKPSRDLKVFFTQACLTFTQVLNPKLLLDITVHSNMHYEPLHHPKGAEVTSLIEIYMTHIN